MGVTRRIVKVRLNREPHARPDTLPGRLSLHKYLINNAQNTHQNHPPTRIIILGPVDRQNALRGCSSAEHCLSSVNSKRLRLNILLLYQQTRTVPSYLLSFRSTFMSLGSVFQFLDKVLYISFVILIIRIFS